MTVEFEFEHLELAVCKTGDQSVAGFDELEIVDGLVKADHSAELAVAQEYSDLCRCLAFGCWIERIGENDRDSDDNDKNEKEREREQTLDGKAKILFVDGKGNNTVEFRSRESFTDDRRPFCLFILDRDDTCLDDRFVAVGFVIRMWQHARTQVRRERERERKREGDLESVVF